jgi:hypothetical protein
MKKIFRYLLIILCPYYIVLILVLHVLYSTMDMQGAQYFSYDLIGNLVTFIPVFCIASLLSSVILFIYNLINQQPLTDLFRANLLIKLIHIPAYIFLFVAGITSLITIITAGFSLVMMALDALIIFTSGLIGLSAVILAIRDKDFSIPTPFLVILGFLQFIFVLDVIAAIIHFILYKRNVEKQNGIEQL